MATVLSKPLRVLVLGNFSAAPCGIRNAADMTVAGLRAYGSDVTAWDVTYPLVYARREAGEPTYVPDDVLTYDVVHLNWHPIALNTYGPGHFPWPKGTGPLVSVYLNDVPPWSGCPVSARAEVLVAPEAYSDVHEGPITGPDHLMVYPIPDWLTDLPTPAAEFTVGWSGVRGDGAAEIRGVCEQYGWAMNMTEAPGDRTLPWTSFEDEVRRLARSTVNVCWYHQQRGIAGTPSVALGARRPLLLNDSQMFRPWRVWHPRENQYAYGQEIYLGERSLENALCQIHIDWTRGTLRTPGPRVYRDYGWQTAARNLTAAWRTALEAR